MEQHSYLAFVVVGSLEVVVLVDMDSELVHMHSVAFADMYLDNLVNTVAYVAVAVNSQTLGMNHYDLLSLDIRESWISVHNIRFLLFYI